MIILVAMLVGVLLLIFLRSATKGKISRSAIVLQDQLKSEEGYLSSDDLQFFVGRTALPSRCCARRAWRILTA